MHTYIQPRVAYTHKVSIYLLVCLCVVGYDFCQVCGWFANRADLIVLIFDAHKLDISDEFRNAIESLKGNDDKIRCILNKADQVDRQKLMRVYGALMWSLGKVRFNCCLLSNILVYGCMHLCMYYVWIDSCMYVCMYVCMSLGKVRFNYCLLSNILMY